MLIDVMGKPFPELMRELVLEPLGMADSTYEQPLPEALWGRAATGHYWVSNEPVDGKWHIYPEMAAAGLWTTAGDLARFGVEVQRARQGEAGRLLAPETVIEMLSPQAAENTGIGFFLKGDRFGHDGDDHGFVASLKVYAKRGLGAVVMANSLSGGDLIEEVMRGIAREYGWPDYLPEEPVASKVDTVQFSRFAGQYEMRSDFNVKIAVGGEGLTLEVPGQNPIALHAKSQAEFFAGAVHAEVRFEGEDEEPSTLVLTQGDEEMRGRRRG
jgi:CubicO group peptidase (beta-lactamase class C family)